MHKGETLYLQSIEDYKGTKALNGLVATVASATENAVAMTNGVCHGVGVCACAHVCVCMSPLKASSDAFATIPVIARVSILVFNNISPDVVGNWG